MRFSNKLSLSLITCGLIVLVILSFAVYKLSYNVIIKSQLMNTESVAKEVANNINQLLLEKMKTVVTLANSPTIKKALELSNIFYVNQSVEQRKEAIKLLNEKWKSINDIHDDFILKFTGNKVSIYLKNQQEILPGEYGEIFLTNKFGALVSSTSKLSTFAHGHKYWWVGAYNNGDGALYWDDRGYDDSVGGYVLGLAIPVKENNRIIGILKCNLNILGGISKLISNPKDNSIGKFKLARLGGMVVFEEGFEPLTTQIHASVLEKMKSRKNNAFIIQELDEKYLIGFSKISLTTGKEGFKFGGTFRSQDHNKGNLGEPWYIFNYRSFDLIQKPIVELIKWIVLIGVIIILILSIVSHLLGNAIAKPLALLEKATKKIGKGEFEYYISIDRNDEFGNLAKSFNKMVKELNQNTTSIKLLEGEIANRKSAEMSLQIERDNLKSIFESMEDGVYLADKDFNLQHVNPVLKNEFGPSRGKKCYEYFHCFKKPCSFCRTAKVYIGETIHWELVSKKNNKIYDIVESPIKNTDGSMLKLSVLRDVTGLKKLAERLQQSQKMEAIGQLAAGIAHEINNPIGFISSNLDALKDYINDINSLILYYRELEEALKNSTRTNQSLDIKNKILIISNFRENIDLDYIISDVPELLKDCKDGTGRVGKIVDDLKMFAQPGNDKEMHIDINKHLESTLNVVNNEIKYKATVIKNLGDIPMVKGYPQKLNQVFINMLVNAAQAIEENGEIIIQTKKRGQNVVVTISDNGCGIEKEYHPKIFNPFFTTREIGKGTGLGMNTAYNIIKEHNGTIEFTSNIGKGTTFTISLPGLF